LPTSIYIVALNNLNNLANTTLPFSFISCSLAFATARLQVKVQNVIRPIFGNVSVIESKDSVTSSRTLLGLSGGTFELVTSSSVVVEFHQLSAAIGPSFFDPIVKLLDIQTLSRHSVKVLHVSLHSLVMELPTFVSACNRSICFFALEITNTDVDNNMSLPGRIECAPNFHFSDIWNAPPGQCFGPVTAVMLPPSFGPTKMWYSVRYPMCLNNMMHLNSHLARL
jgi:energy-converting hydrogenase Eha subunit E